ncbi:MAG: adenine nucleotide alpha hydrolase [Proteobacteria bacterium]|nr:adenine nucleotide alpha hydrolase [Pseudomonadota bacterium]
MKVFVSWSSGKDSAFAFHEARRGGFEIAGVLTTINEAYDRVAMHGVRNALLDKQIAALGVPAIKVPIPSPCPNEIYEARMDDACAAIKARGIRHIIFGDLFLEDIRAYRVEKLAAAGMEAIFPLWQRDTAQLARDMVASGLVAHVTCLDPRKLPRNFAGRIFDQSFLRDLPAGIDPCGENGEFHTAVIAGPMFAAPIAVTVGETVEREGFVFTDIVPISASANSLRL